MKRVAITGASGFVGSYLSGMLKDMGYIVIPISISTFQSQSKLEEIVSKSDIVINLAGANILQRWSEEYKKLLYSSRIDTTKAIVDAMRKSENKPKLFISTSAVGIYSDKKINNEHNSQYGDTYLSKICIDWENEALKAEEIGIRTAIFRFGVILGDGGALKQMLTPFKFGLGGVIGDGEQPFAYIHIDDLSLMYLHIINNTHLSGVFNLVAPEIITNRQYTKALGGVLNRPTIFPIPKFILTLIFGEGAMVLTDGQKVEPKRALESGFEFRYKDIQSTLKSLIK